MKPNYLVILPTDAAPQPVSLETYPSIEKELEELRKDFQLARDVHAELYGYIDSSQVPKLGEWENLLTDDVFGIEEEVETYFKTLGG